jgi:5-methylcytosine-specific restriction endonuclease McrA
MHQTNFKHDQKTRVDDRLERDRDDDKGWREVCKIVDARDARSCRCCDKRTNADAVGLMRGHRHHIVYRSAGGPDTSANLVTLCAACHNDEHQHRLLIDGNADEKLTFSRKDDHGEWYVSRQEIAVRVVERD